MKKGTVARNCFNIRSTSCVCLFVLRWKRGRELVHCLYKKLQTCLPTSRRPAKPYWKKVVTTIVEGEQRLGHTLQWNLGRSDIEMGRATATNFLFSHHALDWCSRRRKILSPFVHGCLVSSLRMLHLPMSCQQVLLTVFKRKGCSSEDNDYSTT